MKILFVCLGNICRSPAAEGVMRELASHLSLDSAGTGGWHVGDPPYAPMRVAAMKRGIDLSQLRARQFGAADYEVFDLIVAMDRQNARDVEALRPQGDATKVRLLADTDVPDPYYTRDFDGCLDLIQSASVQLLSDIAAWRSR